MRLFIGYFLPKRIAEYVHSIENELFGMNIRGSFTKQENLHLTFKFLGETDEATAEDAKKNTQSLFKAGPSLSPR
jgi:2'-5' RNA ligase